MHSLVVMTNERNRLREDAIRRAEGHSPFLRESMLALPDVQRLVVNFWSAGFCWRAKKLFGTTGR